MKVLITGVDGFTGRYLAPRLSAAGHEVHGLVQMPPRDAVAGTSAVHVCDLDDPPELARIVSEVQPHWVVHLAGISFVADGNAEAMYRVNFLGSRHLLEALASLPRAPEAVLLASSANVYGNATGGMLDESTPPAPANDYAVSKLAMEYLSALYLARLPVIVCRAFNYTGVGQAEAFLLPKIVSHIRQRRPFIELGNLDVARDFSDVRTLVGVYHRLLECPAAVGKTINVCSGRAYTLGEVLAMATEISGHGLEVRVNRAFVRQNEVNILLGNRALLDSIVGTLPSIELRDTLRWMIFPHDTPVAPYA